MEGILFHVGMGFALYRLRAAAAFIVLFCLVDCATIYRSYRRKAERLYADANGHMQRGEYREALDHYEKLASIDPEYRNAEGMRIYVQNLIAGRTETFYQTGIRNEQARLYVAAILSYRDAIRSNDDSNYKDSKTRIEKLLQDPGVKATVKAYNDRGIAQFNAKALLAAKAQFVEALRIDSGDSTARDYKKKADAELSKLADAAYDAGEAMLKANNYLGAQMKYREAVTLFPEHEDAAEKLRQVTLLLANEGHYQAGLASLKAGDPMGALGQFSLIVGYHRDSGNLTRQAQDTIRTNMATYFQQAVGLYEAQRLREALHILRWILVVEPGHDQARKYQELAQKKLETLDKIPTD